MNIKIITCHNVYNHGASLQAYALSKYLNDLGHETRIIDYIPPYLEHYVLWGHVSPHYNRPGLCQAYCLAKFPRRMWDRITDKRKKAFDRFTQEYLPLTPEHYSSYSDLCANPPEADVVIAGSDQIWNTKFQNGKDPAFYLQFAAANTVKASYAASFATSKIEAPWESKVKDWLAGFDAVSVREQTGVALLEQLGFHNGIQVMDPVFLLSRNEWEMLVPEPTVTGSYMLYYGFDGNEEAERSALQFAHQNGYKLVSVLGNKYCDISRKGAGPLEFLGLLRKADMVISSSFHATAFSLIFEKDFMVFKRADSINSRMIDLLQMVGLSDRIADNYIFEKKKIDYTCPRQLIQEQVEKSKDYLKRVLEMAEMRMRS